MISGELKKDLILGMPIEQIFQKHVIDGKSHFFSTILEKVDLEYELRDSFAARLGLNLNNITIVGSAKLGFSLKTHEFKAFDSKFDESKNPRSKSDIDIAIVSRELFDAVSRKIYAMSRHFDIDWIERNWKINSFYTSPRDLYINYVKYLARGWLRPDFLPSLYYNEAEWQDAQKGWYGRLSRKISIGIYSDWYYLKHYQMDNLERLRGELLSMRISI